MKKKETSILVVVDMQNDFTTGPLGNKECFEAIEKVKEVIENGNYDKIIFTMDTHTEEYLSTQEGRRLPVKHCIRGTYGHRVVDSLVEAAANKTKNVSFVEKPTFGSFELAKLIEYSGMGENAVIDFVGVCTGICVISNVLITKAKVPEATVRVIEEACACVTPESHKTAIEAMKLCQVDIV